MNLACNIITVLRISLPYYGQSIRSSLSSVQHEKIKVVFVQENLYIRSCADAEAR